MNCAWTSVALLAVVCSILMWSASATITCAATPTVLTSGQATATFASESCAIVSANGQSTTIYVTSTTFSQIVLVGPGDIVVNFAPATAVSTLGDLVVTDGTVLNSLSISFTQSWTVSTATGSAHFVNVDSFAPTSFVNLYANTFASITASSGSIFYAPTKPAVLQFSWTPASCSSFGAAFIVGTMQGNSQIIMDKGITTTTVLSVASSIVGPSVVTLYGSHSATLTGPYLVAAAATSLTLGSSSGLIASTTGSYLVSITGDLSGSISIASATLTGGSVAQLYVGGTWTPSLATFNGVKFTTAGSNFVVNTLAGGLSFASCTLTSTANGFQNFDITNLGSQTIVLNAGSVGTSIITTTDNNNFRIGSSSSGLISAVGVTMKARSMLHITTASSTISFIGGTASSMSASGHSFFIDAATITLISKPVSVTAGGAAFGVYYAAAASPTITMLSGSSVQTGLASLITLPSVSFTALSFSATGSTITAARFISSNVVTLTSSTLTITGTSSMSVATFFGQTLISSVTMNLNAVISLTGTTPMGVTVTTAQASSLIMSSVTVTAVSGIATMFSFQTGTDMTFSINGLTIPSTTTAAVITNFALGTFSNFQLTAQALSITASAYNFQFSTVSAATPLTITSSKFVVTSVSGVNNIQFTSGFPTTSTTGVNGLVLTSSSFTSVGSSISVIGVQSGLTIGGISISGVSVAISSLAASGFESVAFVKLRSIADSSISMTMSAVSITMTPTAMFQSVVGLLFDTSATLSGSSFLLSNTAITGITTSNTLYQSAAGYAIAGPSGSVKLSSTTLSVSSTTFTNVGTQILVHQGASQSWTAMTITVKCSEMKKIDYLQGTTQLNPVYFNGDLNGVNTLMVDSILADNVTNGNQGFVTVNSITSGSLAITYLNSYFHVFPLVAAAGTTAASKVSVTVGCSRMVSVPLSWVHFQQDLAATVTQNDNICGKPGSGCYHTPSSTQTHTDSVTDVRSYSKSFTASMSSFPTLTRSGTITGTTSVSASVSASLSVSRSMSNEISASRTLTQSMTMSQSLSETTSLSLSMSLTPTSSESVSLTQSLSLSTSLTPTLTESVSLTQSLSLSDSLTPSLTTSLSLTSSLSLTASLTPTISSTPTVTESVSQSASLTPTVSTTPTTTSSVSLTSTQSLTDSATPTTSGSVTVTTTMSLTRTSSLTKSASPSHSQTVSVTTTQSPSSSQTVSQTNTATSSESSTVTSSKSHSPQVSETLTTITKKPTPTVTYQWNQTAPLMSTRFQVVFNGTDWAPLLTVDSANVEYFLRLSLSKKLAMPLENINILEYHVGSLHVLFEVTRNRTFSINDAGLLLLVSQDSAYVYLISYYYNATGQSTGLSGTVVMNPVNLVDTEPSSNIIGIIAGCVIGGLIVIIGVAVWFKFMRHPAGSAASHAPNEADGTELASNRAEVEAKV